SAEIAGRTAGRIARTRHRRYGTRSGDWRRAPARRSPRSPGSAGHPKRPARHASPTRVATIRSSAPIEQRVDEGHDRGALREDDEESEDQQADGQRREPPPFVLPEKRDELSRDAQSLDEPACESHRRYLAAGFSTT